MTCADISAQLAAYHEGGLRPAERYEVALHLTSCPHCQAEMARYDEGDRALRRSVSPAPSDVIYDAVLHRLTLEDTANQRRKTRLIHSVSNWFNLAGTLGAAGVVGVVLVVLVQGMQHAGWSALSADGSATNQTGSVGVQTSLISEQQQQPAVVATPSAPAAGDPMTLATLARGADIYFIRTDDPDRFVDATSQAPIMSIPLLALNASATTVVPTPGIYSAVALSPDGRSMAYGVHSSLPVSRQRGIWIRDAAARTGGKRIVVPHDQPSAQIADICWSSNARDLIFTVETKTSVMLYVDNIANVHHPRVVWSYHGWWPPANQALSPNLRLLATAGHAGGPQDNQSLMVHDLRTSQTHTVGIGASPVWSPDSTRLAYLAGPSPESRVLMVVSAQGGPPQRLTTTPQAIRSVGWSPDGRAIAYTVRAGGQSPETENRVWIVQVAQPPVTLPGFRTRAISDIVWVPPTSSKAR